MTKMERRFDFPRSFRFHGLFIFLTSRLYQKNFDRKQISTRITNKRERKRETKFIDRKSRRIRSVRLFLLFSHPLEQKLLGCRNFRRKIETPTVVSGRSNSPKRAAISI